MNQTFKYYNIIQDTEKPVDRLCSKLFSIEFAVVRMFRFHCCAVIIQQCRRVQFIDVHHNTTNMQAEPEMLGTSMTKICLVVLVQD